MTRTFIQTQEFIRNWKDLGFTDDDLRRLELEILKNPRCGKVIQGTGKIVCENEKMEVLLYE